MSDQQVATKEFDEEEYENEIAIIGMVGRFPDADNIEDFWANLRGGVESVKFLTHDVLRKRGFGDFLDDNPNFISAEASLDTEALKKFDAAFFNMSPREAEIMDPQHRLFLEACWELFEHAGYSTEHYDGRVGVFGATGFSGYLESHLLPNRELLKDVGSFQTGLGNDKDFLSTRVSYKMGFTGPSINVNTLCSSAAVAIHLARESLLNYQTDFAIAGGVNISVSTSDTLYYQEGGIGADDGHCRAYDERATGTVAGSGLGVIAVKRLEDALADGDSIYAVIKGSAVNNDGSHKASYTAPSPEGQAEVIAEALAVSGVPSETISYVEGHGTGTNIGDPIEVTALTKAYGRHTDKKQFCGLGSVKTNIGHLVTAGGVASLIKTVLALKNKEIPPSLNFERANPKIDFENSPFFVNDKLREWVSSDNPRRAGVSSFGIGGTNVHLILEEAPELPKTEQSEAPKLILLSAKSSSALANMKENLYNYLEQNPEINLEDVSYTLKVGRCSFEYRFAAVCREIKELKAQLKAPEDHPSVFHYRQKMLERSTCFIFSDEGSQYQQMAAQLYRSESVFSEPVFKEAVDECADLIQAQLLFDIRPVLYPESLVEPCPLQNTPYAQLSLFVTEYSLVKLWKSWGIKPESLIAHNRVGEYLAACVAEVFSLADAISIVAGYGRFIEVQQSEGDMNEALSLFKNLFAGVNLKKPAVPFISNVSGDWITDEQATDPAYWLKQLQSTTHFHDGIKKVKEDESRVFLEMGPRHQLSILGDMTELDRRLVISSMPQLNERGTEQTTMREALGQLWSMGVMPAWNTSYDGKSCRRISLPTYSFERKRFWIEPKKSSGSVYQADVELTNTGEIDEKCAPDDVFSTGKIQIDFDWPDGSSVEQKQKLMAVMELKKQLEQVCADLSRSNQINLKVSSLGLTKSVKITSDSVLSSNLSALSVNNPRPEIDTPFVEPRTELEKRLAADWEMALGFSPVGINDNFFDVGGHSLIAAAIVNQLRQGYDVEIDLPELLEVPTVAKLAELVGTKQWLLEQSTTKQESDEDEGERETLIL